MTKVLILGGTGAMGKHLVDILVDKGVECMVTSRRQRKSEGLRKYAVGNAHDMDFLHPLLLKEKWDAIVDFMIYTTVDFKSRVNTLLDSTKQYVFISSARVYASNHLLLHIAR